MCAEKNNLNDEELLKAFRKLNECYRDDSGVAVCKGSLLVLLEAFELLYLNRKTKNEELNYLNNLIPTGLIEGDFNDVFGTVEDAIKRTEEFIKSREVIEGSQAESITANLIMIMEREKFNMPAINILHMIEKELLNLPDVS